ncbi:S8 family peptidase [Streptomyces sp. NPDC020965]|uniref:S8 family peptidase n=1 Tax=Streptomyces sp. NPDC020965 TaxID=3365105 RepID=UPI0037AEE4B4
MVAAAAMALVTGAATALPATAAPGQGTPPGSEAAPSGPFTGPTHLIRLITGDAVAVDTRGKPVRIVPGKGREHIPIVTERHKGRIHVIPADARRLIETGRVDKALFDITELGGPEYRKRDRAGLALIVRYGGPEARGAGAKAAATLKAELRKDGGATVRRALPRIGAEALTVPAKSAGDVWKTLTRSSGGAGAPRAAAPGLDRIWLDGIREASLDRTVKQIGAPAAWAEGYDGTGVRIAVLDTGVDETHPELRGREEAERNFSDAPDTKDRNGHGTHVASIAAGTGAGAAGAYRGVAPGARVLDGKVLNDDGYGDDSGILAGIDWAVAQNADIVNLSLGGRDRPGIDPLEEAVNRVSAEHGTLFAVAAGNGGPESGTIDSPGSADAALTVGAVDKSDVISVRSGRGPRVGDGAAKPDVTAPGVAVTAASAPGSKIAERVGEKPPGYVTISGTSMATPHVAGAAALLKQRHPAWTGAQLKAVLAASARPGGAGVFAEGSGRIDVAAALTQTVVSEPASVGFARQLFPHADDRPETRKVTYRNSGAEPVTLDLSVSGVGPDGTPAPAGMFTVDTERVTVPGGGTATVGLTADTRPGGDLNGVYTATVTAKGAGQTVRTVAAVEREIESYQVTLRHIGRDGQPSLDNWPSLYQLTGPGSGGVRLVRVSADVYTARVAKGVHFLHSWDFGANGDQSEISAPHLDITEDTTVTVDARTARPISVTTPDATATRAFVEGNIELDTPVTGFSAGWSAGSFENRFTAQLGPDFSSEGKLFQQFGSIDVQDTTEYRLSYGGRVTRLATGLERRATRADLARIAVREGASVPGKQGRLSSYARLKDGGFGSIITPAIQRPLPVATTVYVTTADTDWVFGLDQLDPTGEFAELSHGTGVVRYEAGKNYRRDFGIGVFGPRLTETQGVTRDGDTITGCLDLHSDGGGHWSYADTDRISATLHRNGVEVSDSPDLLRCWDGVTVPAEKGRFRLSASAIRGGVASVSTETSATWTFDSGHTTASEKLPVSVVRFTPRLATDSTAKSGAVTRVPVTVLGAAAGKNLASLTVSVSRDGMTWQKVKVVKGAVKVRNPKAGQTVSFRAELVDKQGNTLTQTIKDAYRSK